MARSTVIPEVVQLDLPAEPNYDAVHTVGDVVRLHEYVGSAAARKLIYRVTALPDPKARRKAEREAYAIEPIAGGPITRAEAWMLVPGSAADKALAARTVAVDLFHPGTVVTSSRLKGATPTDRLVVLDVARDGTYKVTLLGGSMEGRAWTKIPGALLARVDV